MEKINFENLPSTSTPINATNLNKVQSNVENVFNGDDSMGNIIIEDVKCKNLFNIYNVVKGRLDNGVLGYASNTTNLTIGEDSLSVTTDTAYRGFTSDYISTNELTEYTISFNFSANVSRIIACYNSSKEYLGNTTSISSTKTDTSYNEIVKTLENTAYIRVNIQLTTATTAIISNIQLEKGSVQTSYISHKDFGYVSGSNENGSYIKYDDGTMICYGNKAIGTIDCTNEWGSLYYGDVSDAITFPQEFAEIGSVNVDAVPTTTSGFFTTIASQNLSTTKISTIRFIRPSSGTISPIVTYTAVGKWK